ncbi:MerR family transcriptional regulator [Paenibacillus cymbidii]|uniref:MerR family transcriptional regulator n=1 Tax=Paenibacillus cymbidii TaxID=1639034 RepID=UPI0010816EDC|nr:MerR family transcriptional regulator [Paenibacillus cymbidii]
MAIVYTPSQIAADLKISTTTLRRYEEQGLLPDVPRKAGNHRYYLPIHLQAFATIRALLQGFDIPVAYAVMRAVKTGNATEAFWLMNRQLAATQAEKQRTEDILGMIRSADFPASLQVKRANAMTIGQAAALAGVNPSAIRHWEKEGLIRSERNKDNGYRQFSVHALRNILVIARLRRTVYYMEQMKALLDELDNRRYAAVDRSLHLALEHLGRQLASQFAGVAQLVPYAASMSKSVSG